jgi:hypothetical protein
LKGLLIPELRAKKFRSNLEHKYGIFSAQAQACAAFSAESVTVKTTTVNLYSAISTEPRKGIITAAAMEMRRLGLAHKAHDRRA